MQIKSFLKLIRLPNVLTAACNSLAGAFCAGAGFERWPDLLAIAFASMSLYAAGIVLNDLFDLDEDRLDRPTRPLPSGAVKIWVASAFACFFSVAGCILASSVSSQIGQIALAILAAVVSYDAFLKKTPAGPWAMGLCRGLNLAMGLAFAPLQAWSFIAILAYIIYISGITYISRQETNSGQTKGVFRGFVLMVAGIAAVLAVILLRSDLLKKFNNDLSTIHIATLISILILIILLKIISNAYRSVMANPTPETIQKLVKIGIISLPIIDTSLVLALSFFIFALPLIVIWLIARLTARKLYTT
jgi:4-hydroxybenzoate polyprenyltransferase